MRKVGYITVNVSGEAEIFIPFKPREALVAFVDPEVPPVTPSCNPVVPDSCTVEIREICNPFDNHTHHVLMIKWNVAGPRKLRWEAKKHL